MTATKMTISSRRAARRCSATPLTFDGSRQQ
jgi:hypothetical protein